MSIRSEAELETLFAEGAVPSHQDFVDLIDSLFSQTMRWAGAYSAGTTYFAGDVVLYQGSAYVALQETLGNVPPSVAVEVNDNWQLVAKKGTDGAGAGDMLAANNLNDVADIPSAVANLGVLSLGGGTMTGTVNFADQTLQRPVIRDYGLTVNTVAATGATETLSFETANVHDVTMDQNCTFSFSNPPASGTYGKITVIVRGSFTPTWPASVDWTLAGGAPTYSTPAIYVFFTVDGGTNYFGLQGGRGFG